MSYLYLTDFMSHKCVKNWVSFPLLSVQSRIYWHVSGCSVHFHGYVSIGVGGELKQTYDLVNFEEILSFKNRINVWMWVLPRSVQSRFLLWQHWHVVWQNWPLLTLSSKLQVLLLILIKDFPPLPVCFFGRLRRLTR